jgi:DNA-binding response OmpR family regulator
MSPLSHSPAVLLVEDSDDDAFFFIRALRLAGASARPLHLMDGGAAVAHLKAVRAGTAPRPGGRGGPPPRPDIVFLDLKIPTLSGFDVLTWIGAQHFDPPLEVAVLSGSEHNTDVERAMSLGASGYYVKPILVQQLRSRLHAWHEKHSSTNAPETQAIAGPVGPA